MKDWYFFLFALVLTWTIMMAITFGHLLCRTSFGGIWSSIIIDDCRGSFWSPTASGYPDAMGSMEQLHGKTYV